ncbi:MAG: YceD family protein [Victivallales bacterium]|jgi:uncharacterized protein
MISFSVDLLKKQDIDIEGEEPPSFLEVGDSEMISFKDNIRYKLHASLVSGGILVKGGVSAGYDGVCGRCLEHFKGKFGISDLCLFYENVCGAELDVSEDVRAALVVEIPMNCICNENCLGLCRCCGCNLNKEQCDCEDTDDGNNPWSELNKLKL